MRSDKTNNPMNIQFLLNADEDSHAPTANHFALPFFIELPNPLQQVLDYFMQLATKANTIFSQIVNDNSEGVISEHDCLFSTLPYWLAAIQTLRLLLPHMTTLNLWDMKSQEYFGRLMLSQLMIGHTLIATGGNKDVYQALMNIYFLCLAHMPKLQELGIRVQNQTYLPFHQFANKLYHGASWTSLLQNTGHSLFSHQQTEPEQPTSNIPSENIPTL